MSLNIVSYPTSNQDERSGKDIKIDTLIFHYTGMISNQAALERMTDPKAKVSAHWCIDENGTAYKIVPEHLRAWHAGKSWWRGRSNLNNISIGIEVVNPGHEFGYRPFTLQQMNSIVILCHQILKRHPINPRNIVGHSDVAPDRKKDPGELFDWRRLSNEGIGIWPRSIIEPGNSRILKIKDYGPEVKLCQKKLAKFGYGLYQDGIYGEKTQMVVMAFQRHYRQARVDGVLDHGTTAILDHLVNYTKDK
ncbi:MAG: N-acetylmuramoyl-L-alanine amidase [Alphaproteobacteria bacterium]|nr:N-acetylmuramoyl-L-alanine amidase [Alphaproteobacteria bacterium]|tara:strand:- start:516 stop:1262 length:747 start_codon:yes stop_codon:yes gene_type:complete